MQIIGISPDQSSDYSRLLIGLFAEDALTGAAAEVASWTDAAELANGNAALALDFAGAGQFDRAFIIACRLDASAQASLRQAERLPSPIDATRAAHVLRTRLAPALAATGRKAEAAEMAADLSWPVITALVAARLE